jgi:hypothetical protein
LTLKQIRVKMSNLTGQPDYQLVRKFQAAASHPNDGMLVIKARCGIHTRSPQQL